VLLAMMATQWLDDAAILHLSSSLNTAISELKPVRAALNRHVELTI
jgi:hypothetical protein